MLRRDGRGETNVFNSIKSNVGKTRDETVLDDFVSEGDIGTKSVVPFSMEALRDQIESQALHSESKLVFGEPKLAGDIFGSRPTSKHERSMSKQGRPRNGGDFDGFPFFEMEVNKSTNPPPPDPNEKKTGFIFNDIISQFTNPVKPPRGSSASTLNVDYVDRMNEGRLNRLSLMQSGGRGIEETDIIEGFLKREGSGVLDAQSTFKDVGRGRAGVSLFPE
jgi:hypothetical protein